MTLTRKKKIALLLWLRNKIKKRQPMSRRYRSISIRPINQRRDTDGEYHHLMPKLLEDEEQFKDYMRMTQETFQLLLSQCSKDLTKSTTNFRKAIPPEERLVVTIRFLATGDSFHSLAFRFRMGCSTIRQIILESAKVIWTRLQPVEMPFPDKSMWKDIASNFFKQWNFPLCLGAIDGTHIKIKAPPNAGSKYLNYKGHHSIVLMAGVDGDGKFIFIEVGAYGSYSHDEIFQDSQFNKLLTAEKLSIPKPTNLPGTDIYSPYVFVADKAFPLSQCLMRPFPRRNLDKEKKIFNSRLSRARHIVDSAFDIASSTWPVLNSLEVEDAFARDIVKAACVLHNFILNHQQRVPETESERKHNVPAIDSKSPTSCQPCYRRPSNKAMAVRGTFASYFMSAHGSVPWQEDMI